MKKKLLFIWWIFIGIHLNAQQAISYNEFVDLLHRGGTIENYFVEAAEDDYFDNIYGIDSEQYEVHAVSIRNCSFQRLSILNLKVNTNLTIDNCIFRDPEPFYETGGSWSGDVLLVGTEVGYQLNLFDNKKNNEYILYEISESIIANLIIFPNDSIFYGSPCYLLIEGTEITHSLYIFDPAVNHIDLSSSKFFYGVEHSNIPYDSIRPNFDGLYVSAMAYRKSMENLIIDECEFYTPIDFSYINVNEEFSITNSKFHGGIDLFSAKLNTGFTEIEWSSVSKSLFSLSAKDEEERYNSLQNAYLVLIDFYREKNLSIERKLSFIEYKEFEREHFRRMITLNGFSDRIRSFVTYFFLSLLKWLSNYSTDFILTFWRTIEIIFFFGFFYFFYNTIVFNSHKIYNYFRQKNKSRRLRKRFMRSQKALRKLYTFFGASFNECNYHSRRQLIDETSKITKKKFIWRFFIRELIVSFFASLNFFVTLGFAGVTLHGKLKYFAIIEGMLGWLVLVILSAALVNSFIMI